jgi:hypothetical protein
MAGKNSGAPGCAGYRRYRIDAFPRRRVSRWLVDSPWLARPVGASSFFIAGIVVWSMLLEPTAELEGHWTRSSLHCVSSARLAASSFSCSTTTCSTTSEPTIPLLWRFKPVSGPTGPAPRSCRAFFGALLGAPWRIAGNAEPPDGESHVGSSPNVHRSESQRRPPDPRSDAVEAPNVIGEDASTDRFRVPDGQEVPGDEGPQHALERLSHQASGGWKHLGLRRLV